MYCLAPIGDRDYNRQKNIKTTIGIHSRPHSLLGEAPAKQRKAFELRIRWFAFKGIPGKYRVWG